MNDDLFFDSGRILEQNWELILAILICVTWGTLLIFATLKKTITEHITDIELIALALGGWPLLVLLLSILILLLHTIFNIQIIFVISLALITISTVFAIRAVWKNSSLGFVPLILIFLIFVFIRLGFASRAILPLYFDSAEHYRIIQSIIQARSFIWPVASYYHLGYHVMLAGVTLITQAELGQVMLIFGQIIVAALPFPIYFFVRRATGSDSAAFFGVILAAFGWFMPAHAVNWGKYPALLGLLVFQFTLGMMFIKKYWLLTFAVLASILIHTRTIILISTFGMTWILSVVWETQTLNKRIVIFTLTAAMLGMLILLIGTNQVISPILEPYRNPTSLLTALLAVSVFRSFPRLTFMSILSILLLLVGMFIPITSAITLLDRPLVEMILFLPLAFLGGLGVARFPKFVVMMLTIFIIAHAFMTYNFYPSDCCQLAGRDDVAALDWMDKNLPANARIAIASTDLGLNAVGEPMQGTGVDAGIWITPLTQRSILSLPHSTDFATQATHELLCREHVTYIYVGSRLHSFNSDFVITKPEWYKMIFFLPNAQIVQALNCGDKT